MPGTNSPALPRAFAAVAVTLLFESFARSNQMAEHVIEKMKDPVAEMMKANSTSVESTIFTPPSTEKLDDFEERTTQEDEEHAFSVPQPGKTFLLRKRTSGNLLTLLNGAVRLFPPGIPGSAYHWSCHEREGWIGFKNVATGKWLVFNNERTLHANATHHQDWESFFMRSMPEGGYVLLMRHWNVLWPLKRTGSDKLGKVKAPVKQGLVWDFIEV